MVSANCGYPHLVLEPILRCINRFLELVFFTKDLSKVSQNLCKTHILSCAPHSGAKSSSVRFNHWVIMYRFQKYILLWVWYTHRQQKSGYRHPQYTRKHEVWASKLDKCGQTLEPMDSCWQCCTSVKCSSFICYTFCFSLFILTPFLTLRLLFRAPFSSLPALRSAS